MKTKSRLYFIDYIRTFVVLFVVLDHVAQAYALRAGAKFSWFVKDPTRTTFFDGFHLIIDTFHMAIFFLLAGLFTLPSASHRGMGNFMKERLIKLGIPFVLGVALLVPPQTYFKHLQKTGDMGYWDYVVNIFFKMDWYASSWFSFDYPLFTMDWHASSWFSFDYPLFKIDWYALTLSSFDYPLFTGDLTSSGFWFLFYLMIFSIVAILIYKLFPFVIRWLGCAAGWLIENPIVGYISLSLFSALLISVAEVFWADRFWVGFWKLFYLRGNLMPLYILFFSLGIGLRESGYMDKTEWLDTLGSKWLAWTAYTTVLAGIYLWYCLTYMDDGAYSLDVLIHFYRGGDWSNVWPVLRDAGPATWVRTTLHGFLYTGITISLVAIFYQFLNKQNKFWMMMTGSAFGIYIFHEPICAWLAYAMADTSYPTLFKFIVAGFGGYFLSWLLLDKALLKIPLIKRVIG